MFQNRSMIKIAFHLMSLNEAESKHFRPILVELVCNIPKKAISPVVLKQLVMPKLVQSLELPQWHYPTSHHHGTNTRRFPGYIATRCPSEAEETTGKEDDPNIIESRRASGTATLPAAIKRRL